MPKTTKKPPAGYTYKYVWPDSDYATHRRRVLVKKKPPKDAITGEYIRKKKKKK